MRKLAQYRRNNHPNGGFDAERRQQAIIAAKRRARIIAMGFNPGCLD